MMKRNWKLALCLMLAALVLTACSAQPKPEDFPDITQAIGPTSTPAPTPVPVADTQEDSDEPEGGESIFSANPYDQDFTEQDALDEENFIDPYASSRSPVQSLYMSQPQGTPYVYAGSTPIPLDPLDMPTPTPRPDLKFTYTSYTASTVGVTFEGPVSWQVDESISSMMILSEPQSQIKDNQQCIITLSAEPIAGNYSKSELETHVRQRLDTIGGSQYTEWSPSYTATRHLMGSQGVYANYSGTLNDGTEVGGRIHYVCIDGVLYGVEIVFPLGFKEDFLDVFTQIRSTIALIR